IFRILKQKRNANFTTVFDTNIFDRFSSYSKLVRVIAWMFRFMKNSKSAVENRTLSAITTSECQEANIKLCKNKHGMIRVGGRLRHSNLPFEQRHPIILPKNHQLSKLIIRHEHHKNLDASTQLVLAQIRQQFWILNGKQTVRSELRKCTICFRAKPFDNNYYMGDLPKARVNPGRIFSSIGVDFAGPTTGGQ
ncbi:hypothetical protein NQ317_003720, partial [Molorchus minor]